jgi:hypothetical protein
MSRSQNLMEPLQYVTAPYRAAALRSGPVYPTSREGRADEFATLSGLGPERMADTRRLREAAASLHGAPHLAALLPQVLEQAMLLMSAEFANIQLVDPRDGSLVLVAQSGFGPGFLEHFAVVRDHDSVCGQAAWQGAQAVVADVRADPVLQPHWEVFSAAGIRAVQSTPLVDSFGRMIGMLSTHTPWPRRPSEWDLQVMGLYSRFAGEAFARLLDGTPAVGDPLGPGRNGHRRGTAR